MFTVRPCAFAVQELTRVQSHRRGTTEVLTPSSHTPSLDPERREDVVDGRSKARFNMRSVRSCGCERATGLRGIWILADLNVDHETQQSGDRGDRVCSLTVIFDIMKGRVQPIFRRGKPKLFDRETLVAVECAESHRVMISSWRVTAPIWL